MSEPIDLTTARLQQQVPAAETRIDDALIAISSLFTSVVTARRDIAHVPAARGQASLLRLAKVQMALVDASGDVLRVHGDLADIARETSGLDLHECPDAVRPQGSGQALAG